jgi:hypothetical protein
MKRFSRSNEYGNALVTGLLRHMSAVTYRLEKQNLYAFPLRSFRSCLRSKKCSRVYGLELGGKSSSNANVGPIAKLVKEEVLSNCNALWL